MPNYRYYYVIDQDDCVTCDKDDLQEFFLTEALATARAKVAAEENPGKRFRVAQTINVVSCPVCDAEVVECTEDEPAE